MMSRREAYNLYSVFVGHLSMSVSKAELFELFSGCGEVEDVFIGDSGSSQYSYGFVRFREVESVFKAVKTLHRWPLKGVKIVVDVAKDTGDKIKKEGEIKINIDKLSSSSSLSAPLVRDRLYTGTKSSIIQDVVQLGRLKETYASLSVEAKQHTGAFSGHKSLSVTDIETFMEDVEQSYGIKSDCYEGKIHSDVTPDSVYQALLNSDDMDPAFGMQRSNQFLSALRVVMGNVASFLKDHELLSAEAGEMFDLCNREVQNEEEEEEEKYEEESSSGSSSSHSQRKVYRDSGFESELETKPREPESPESELCPVFDNLTSPNQEGPKSSPHLQKEIIQSQSSKCSSSEPESMEDLKQFDDDTQKSGERRSDWVLEEPEQKTFKSLGELIPMKQNSIEKVKEMVNPELHGVQLRVDSILKKEKANKPDDVLDIDTPMVKQADIRVEEENTVSSVSSLSSSTGSSQSTKLQRSNYYRPLSPVAPDLSIISSALHSKPSKPYSGVQCSNNTLVTCRPKSIPIVEPIVDRLPNAISSPITESFYVDTSPVTSSSPIINPLYENHHVNSAPPINDFVSKTDSSEISVNQESRDVQTSTSIRRPVFHKSISDSCVTSLQNYTRSPPNDGSSKTSRNPELEALQRLDLSELFVSCNGKKQGVDTKQLCLNDMFRSCNGKKWELPVENQLCLHAKIDAPQTHLPKGVSFEECQRNSETVKLGRGRGLDSLRKTLK